MYADLGTRTRLVPNGDYLGALMRRTRSRCAAAVDLYWLPLGAGGHSVRYNGRAYEALVARKEGRRACDLYHSALQVELGQDSYVIEQAPVPNLSGGSDRGVVAGGAVGARWAARLHLPL